MAKRGIYRRRHRKDTNQDPIVEYLRKAGVSVSIIGEPTDLVCAWGGVTDLAEVKTEDGEFNPDQVTFYKGWQGRKVVLRTLLDARDYVTSLKRRSSLLGAAAARELAS